MSVKHKVGNMISGLCSIVDGIVLFITLGNWNISLCLNWNIYRKSKNVLVDK